MKKKTSKAVLATNSKLVCLSVKITKTNTKINIKGIH